MKKFLTGVAFAITAAINSASATVISFDGVPAGTIIPVGALDSIGVQFDQTLVVIDSSSTALPSSGLNAAAGPG